MTSGDPLSRPLRLATQLTGSRPEEARAHLLRAAVHVRITAGSEDSHDAAILALSLVDQLSRFCGAVIVSAPAAITQACLARDRELHDQQRVHADTDAAARTSALEVCIGDCLRVPGSIAACSDGWIGRFYAAVCEPAPAFKVINPIGALTAAALTAGEVFLRLIGITRPPRAFELSAWTGACGPPGSVPDGPRLPAIPPVDALLIGCGNVMNGWAVAARALQVTGQVRAVDRQSLGEENLGPYALARLDMIGQPKTALLAGYLQPSITVTRHDEELDLFVPRITRWHLPLPHLVINGLDEVEPRHVVQRLWPDALIDMAAGGTTSQVILSRRGDPGQCLLGAFAKPGTEHGYIQRTETATGLRPERFLNEFTTPVTARDVIQAPPEHRTRLQAAADSGQQVCGYINHASLNEANGDEDFAPAAPFVSALTGARAAAISTALLTGHHIPGGMHWQYNFMSNRARTTVMRCPDACECHGKHRP